MGGQILPGQPRLMQGPTLDRTPFRHRATHTPHTHSDWENWDTLVNLSCPCLGCWKDTEHPEKTHTGIGQYANSTQIAAPARNYIFALTLYQNNIEWDDIIQGPVVSSL